MLLLVVLPAGSWFYLQKGYEHRKAALEELKDFGKVGDFVLTDQFGRTLTNSALHQRVTIAGMLPGDAEGQKFWTRRLLEVQEQFDNRNEVCFLLFADTSAIRSLSAFSEEYGLTDSLQWELLPASRDQVKQLFHLPDFQYLALADTAAVVRRHYDITDNLQMGRLLEQVNIVLPRLPDPDIEFRRNREK